MNTSSRSRLLFTRPLYLSIALATTVEFINFILFGLIFSGEGSSLKAFVWTVGIGGIGMGSVLGVLIDIVIVGTARGRDAFWATVILAVLTLGLVAKLFTWHMGSTVEALGVAQWPVLYLAVGGVLALLAGLTLGWLLFTPAGNRMLARYGL